MPDVYVLFYLLILPAERVVAYGMRLTPALGFGSRDLDFDLFTSGFRAT